MRWHETIALFGGRFDPPHLGHFEAIRGLFERPGVREVWVLPSPTPPHKPAIASFENRVEMARLGLVQVEAGRARYAYNEVRLDLRELARAQARPDLPTYTFDTLQEIRREQKNIAFVLGTDQLEQLHTWHRFPEILKLSHWIVVGRNPGGPERAQAALRDWEASGLLRAKDSENWAISGGDTFLTVVPTPAPDVSSTVIREAIARSGEPPQNSLQPAVLAYLKQNAVYGTRCNSK